MQRLHWFILIFIILLSLVLRVYRLDSVPPSVTWDEAAVGVNAWTIANYGRDEYGKSWPAYFKSFADDKHPVHIYFTALSVKLLGLSEFSTRIPSAAFGVFNVILIFFLAKVMFSSTAVGFFASLFLAISPYNIHFSRFNHEANFALFFFMLGLFLFYLAINKNIKLLPLSALSLGVSFVAYHPSKVIVTMVGLILFILYRKRIFANKTGLLLTLPVVLIFSLLIFRNPQLLGIARIGQTSLGKGEIEKTKAFQLTRNETLGRLHLTLIQYSWLVSPRYLFISGDKNSRLSDQATGQFYQLDALFLLLGVIYLLRKRSKAGLVLLSWVIISPLPSASVAEAPHAGRAMFMMGSWHLVVALGLFEIINLVKNRYIKLIILMSSLLIFSFLLVSYLNRYYGEFAKRYAIDWQYGMKQIVEYTKSHPEYSQVFMTKTRSQPYIFFLYYLKTPLPEYLNSVVYNRSESASYNTVSYFDKYYFEGWNPIESLPEDGVLYILTPSEYDGLRYKLIFSVKKVIYYPNGTIAYYIVSLK